MPHCIRTVRILKKPRLDAAGSELEKSAREELQKAASSRELLSPWGQVPCIGARAIRSINELTGGLKELQVMDLCVHRTNSVTQREFFFFLLLCLQLHRVALCCVHSYIVLRLKGKRGSQLWLNFVIPSGSCRSSGQKCSVL